MDIIDDGNRLAEQHLAVALARHQANQRPQGVELISEGRVICQDCKEPIDKARVNILHYSGLPALTCTDCQTVREKR